MESHLLQMRGLKLLLLLIFCMLIGSHLLQMRGLKPVVDRVTGSGKRRIFYRCVD